MGHLDAATHAELKEQDIPFRRGTFRYDSILLDEVANRLAQEPFSKSLKRSGSTTRLQRRAGRHPLDVHAQREATYSVWHHLSEIGPLLEGTGAEALVLSADAAPAVTPDEPLPRTFSQRGSRLRTPRSAPFPRSRRTALHGDRSGGSNGPCAGGRPYQTWRRSGDKRDVDAIFSTLKPGVVTWVSVRGGALATSNSARRFKAGL